MYYSNSLFIKEAMCPTWQITSCNIYVQCFGAPRHERMPSLIHSFCFFFRRDTTGVMRSVRNFSSRLTQQFKGIYFQLKVTVSTSSLRDGWEWDWKTVFMHTWKSLQEPTEVSHMTNTVSRHCIDMKASDEDDEFSWPQYRKYHPNSSKWGSVERWDNTGLLLVYYCCTLLYVV